MLQGVPGLGQMDWGRVVRKEGKGPGGEGGGGRGPVCRLWLSQGVCSGILSLEFVSVDTYVGVRLSWYLITPSPASVTGKM